MSHRSRLTLTALTLVAAAAFAPQAQASGFQLREQSPSAQGNAFAGISAGGSDISSLFFNPAVMTQFDGTQFTFGGTYIGISAKWADGSAARTPSLQGLGFQSAPVTGTNLSVISGSATHDNAAVPAVLPEFNIMYSPSKDLRLGLSVNVPFGLTTSYDANWIGRYHALKSELKVIDVTPSLAYRVNKEFSFGGAVVLRRADAKLTNGVDYGTALALKVGSGLAAAGLSPVSPGPGQNSPVAVVAMGAPNATFGTPGYAIPGAWDGKAGLSGGGWGYGYKLGMTYEHGDSFRLGLGHQSGMVMTLKGDATFEFPSALPATDLAALNAGGLRNGKGQAEMKLPSTTSLGLDWKLTPTFSLQGEFAYTTWSTFQELRVKFTDNTPPQTTESITAENWNDTSFIALGATWKTSQRMTLRAGLAYDKSAVADAYRTPRIPDNDRKWVSFGGSYVYSRKMTLDFSYTRIFVGDGKVMLTAAGDNITRGSLNGTIQAAINILGAGMRYTF
jgi:long-chain fatty acid transport protein